MSQASRVKCLRKAFAAALSLYYVINNMVSIVQIYRNLKKPLPALKRKPKDK